MRNDPDTLYADGYYDGLRHGKQTSKICIACELGRHQVCEDNRNTMCPCDHRDVINAAIEAQRLADDVVDAAIKWHLSDVKQCMDKAETLEKAIDTLLEFRRKMPIVKQR